MQVALIHAGSSKYLQVALIHAGSSKYMQVYVCTDKTVQVCECVLRSPAVCSVEEQGEVRHEGEVYTH